MYLILKDTQLAKGAIMKVEATKLGFYGNKRRVAGSTFHIKDKKEFSKLWMKEVKESKPSKQKPAKPSKPSVDLNKEVI